MSAFRMSELAKSAGGILHKSVDEEEISELLIDSRKVYRPAQSLFIAIKTGRNDGHRFIPELIRIGVKNFLVSALPVHEYAGQGNYLLVPDTLIAMQKIASVHRQKFFYPVTAITGSNGKTIVKEWIYELMRGEKHIVRSPKSYNSQVGVPLSVWLMDDGYDLALIEAGISMPGEMLALEEMIKPDLGIFTNIGSAHIENFGSREAILDEKLKLFSNVSKLYYCYDHQLIRDKVSQKGMHTVSWGEDAGADFRIKSAKQSGQQTNFNLEYQGQSIHISVPFTDKASLENVLHAIVFAIDQGMATENVITRVSRLHAVEMRLELRKGKFQCAIINDSYSADIESLKIALDYMLQQVQYQKRTVILSDFLETGESAPSFYKKIAELLTNKGIHRLIGVGKQINVCGKFFQGEIQVFANTEELLEHLPSVPFSAECILVKGARKFGFERLISALQEKYHETVLEVNLSAMIHNLNYYRSIIPSGVKTMAMVKAFSYGSGSAEVANMLQANGVDYLAVAYADEGIELRKAGISLPVMVMNPEVTGLQELISFGLEPEIYSFRLLNLFEQAVRENSGHDGYPVKVHLKLDTGMHRLGFGENEIPTLIDALNRMNHLEIASIFSHLAASEDPQQDDFTNLQIGRFNSWTNKIRKDTGRSFMRHILNSAGISRHPNGIFNMVRLGIGLYGIGNSHEQAHLMHVSSLRTSISQIRQVQPGESVGYGRRGNITETKRIATIAIGYADGFSRKLGNGKGYVLIHGKKASTIGSICMDMCMVDISHIPEACEGDAAIVFNHPEHLHQLSSILETIPYEILTGISARVKRVYFQE
jgi:Alr-MurF fusion protein